LLETPECGAGVVIPIILDATPDKLLGVNIQKLMKQMQQAQVKQAEMQEKLEALEVTGTAGGGMVTVTCNGSGQIKSLKVDKIVVDPDDAEALEDLILVAIKDAQQKASDAQQAEVNKLMSGMGGLPGMR
jgi:nucleoid-associated protein EbfC